MWLNRYWNIYLRKFIPLDNEKDEWKICSTAIEIAIYVLRDLLNATKKELPQLSQQELRYQT